MEYVTPPGQAPDSSYVDANPAGGVDGSIVTAEAVEHCMREIVNAITAAGLTPDSGDLAQLAAAIAGATQFPVGSTISYAGPAAPGGWLLCDGAEISRTTFAALFAAIGTNWGVGDGATTFNLPDLRGRTVIGVGQGGGLTNRALADLGGEEAHQLTVDELPQHTHDNSPAALTLGGSSQGTAGSFFGSSAAATAGITGYGGPQAANVMQPYAALNWIIKT